jgi:tRNA-2-methylthio-N6-dimethylallyladenosine synthase
MTLQELQPEVIGRRVYLETFGCQMNELDSELVRGQLVALGYRFVREPAGADVILYNTCSVREQAENKALSRVGRIAIEKKQGREVVLGLIGCLAEREGEKLLDRFPAIDLLCGPGELDKLPMLLNNVSTMRQVERADRIALQGSNSRRASTLAAAEDTLEMLDLSRAFDPDGAPAGGRAAYARITRGCNKFCTYCVVPFTRGAEVHRPPDAIVDECRRLADAGVIEVTLLGQTVNHYLYTHGTAVRVNGIEAPQIGPGARAFRANGHASAGRTTTFADLLRRIHDEVPAIQRLRFVTSYPRDFSDEALRAMAECPRICRYLHVPAQSGSDRILGTMNRGYTVDEYLAFIERARAIVPDVCIAGDVIVGFPGETDHDFEATKRLLERVRYKNCFIFKYSPRPGTLAHDRLPDDVPEAVKRRRNNELLDLQSRISAELHAAWVGRIVEVFVEQVSPGSRKRGGSIELGWERPREQLSGRTGGDLIVVFDAPPGMTGADLIGRILSVKVENSGPLILHGTPVGWVAEATEATEAGLAV